MGCYLLLVCIPLLVNYKLFTQTFLRSPHVYLKATFVAIIAKDIHTLGRKF